jgi:hypothetical protein
MGKDRGRQIACLIGHSGVGYQADAPEQCDDAREMWY